MRRHLTHTTRLLAVLLPTLAIGCSAFEGTPPPNPELVGDWVATDDSATLDISSSGHIRYFRSRGSSTTEINLPAKAWTDEGFTVGVFGMSTDFTLDSPPEQNDGVWHMTVDGLEYTR